MVHPLNEWETNLGIVELFDMRPSALAGSDRLDFDDLKNTRTKDAIDRLDTLGSSRVTMDVRDENGTYLN